jgi:hypothetical protein
MEYCKEANMTVKGIKTIREEANDVKYRKKRFIHRENKNYRVGDRFNFIVMENKEIIKHSIDKDLYEITFIEDLSAGIVALGFERVG